MKDTYAKQSAGLRDCRIWRNKFKIHCPMQIPAWKFFAKLSRRGVDNTIAVFFVAQANID